METIADSVHNLQEDLIKIKTNQNSQADSAMMYRLDVNVQQFQPQTGLVYLRIEVKPRSYAFPDKIIVMPIAESNIPPTLVPMDLSVGHNPGNQYVMYYMLYGKDGHYQKFAINGAHFTVYSNVQLELVSVTEVEIWG